MTATTTRLTLEPTTAGRLRLRNRIVMAPMTRSRADGTRPTDDTATYYAQRAGAGLIVTEGIQPSPVGQGYPATPGLHAPDQVAAWRRVTDRVHAAGGTIVAQLMHTGRIAHPSNTAAAGHGALTPVAPSAVTAAGQIFTPTGPQDHVEPHALTEAEIAATVADFATAARHAIEAGFDGVEIHGANGYLLHQFLATNTNRRDDAWGGTPEGRMRFPLEVTRAVARAIGADRTGIRLSPANGLGDTVEDDHATLYPRLVTELDTLDLAYLHLVEAGDPGLTPVLRAAWSGTLILNPAEPDAAQRLDLVETGAADAVSFARLFIANPDLVDRLALGAELAEPDLSLAYGGDARGYTDYPTLPGQTRYRPASDPKEHAMHAYTLTAYGPDGLVPADVPEPDLGAGQVAIAVEHIAINPLDWKIRNGYLADMVPIPLPAVIGTDVAGTVLATGAGVDDLATGDRVVGFADSGAYAAVAVTRRERVARVPDGLDLRRAAALATAAETAQRALGLLPLAPGSTVVVNGAAGSVGSAVVQLLVAAGHRVLGTAGPANHDYLRRLGAQPVGYGASLLDDLRRVAPDGVDAAVDAAGRDFVARVDGVVPAARIVTIVDFEAAARGAIVAGGDPTQLSAATLGPVLERAAAGAFAVEIDSVYPFDRLPDALARSEGGHLRGKLVVEGPLG